MLSGVLVALRAIGVVITIGGVALLTREREHSGDQGRSIRGRRTALWILVIAFGAALTAWAVFAE
jgi:hypothetical protein